MFRGLK